MTKLCHGLNSRHLHMLNLTRKLKLAFGRVENIVGQGENAIEKKQKKKPIYLCFLINT